MASEPTPLGPREWTRCSDSVICEAWTFCKDHWIGAAGSALVGIITLASHPIYALVVGQEQAATDLPSILYFAIVAVVIGLSVFLIGIIVAPVRIRKRERIACDEAQRKLAEDTLEQLPRSRTKSGTGERSFYRNLRSMAASLDGGRKSKPAKGESSGSYGSFHHLTPLPSETCPSQSGRRRTRTSYGGLTERLWRKRTFRSTRYSRQN